MATRTGRTEPCGRAQSQVRLAQARKFVDTAELIMTEEDDLATPGAAAALAVLAGIAAADALCCVNLGRRARGQAHREATTLLAQVEPGGRELSRCLARLLEIKDGAQYGTIYLSLGRAKRQSATRAR